MEDEALEYRRLQQQVGKKLIEISELLNKMSEIAFDIPVQVLEGNELDENPVIDWDPVKESQASDAWCNILKRMSYLLYEVTTAESSKEFLSCANDKQFTKHIDDCMNELVNLLPEYYWDTFVVESEND